MFARALRAEFLKLRHSPIWLAFGILALLPAVIGTVNYAYNIAILQNQWYDLWSQHTLFSCYFSLPALIGVYCSYLWHLEHADHNWIGVLTAPIPSIYVYLAKLFVSGVLMALTQVWVGLLFVASGWLAGLSSPLPAELPVWLLVGAAGGIIISAVQLCLSLVIRSFAAPVGLALIGGIAGLVAMAKGYGVWLAYALLALGMSANNAQGGLQCSPGAFAASCVIYLAICIAFAGVWLARRDIVTG